MTSDLERLKMLKADLENQAVTSPGWFVVLDHVVTVLLQREIEKEMLGDRL